jgi:metal-responsive CopG/Arc/MetJ family transcriptional regulator
MAKKKVLVNTSGWSKGEIKMLNELVKKEGSDRSKVLRKLVREALEGLLVEYEPHPQRMDKAVK